MQTNTSQLPKDNAQLTMVLSQIHIYIGPKSRIERTRKTKIGTEVADVTRDSDTTFKVKRSKVTGAGHIVAASRLQRVFKYDRTETSSVICTPESEYKILC